MSQSELSRQLDSIASVALSSKETVRNSFDMAIHCINAGIEGDFVECGVFAGSQVAAMALACKSRGVKRTIHLYDSFIGIPQSGPNDDETITGCIGKGSGLLRSTGVSVCSRKQVEEYLRGWKIPLNGMVWHDGWFQDTLPVNPPAKIALLRLDGDLYESTKVCMDHLYHRIQHGGICIVDDYALTGCRKAVDEYMFNHDDDTKFNLVAEIEGPVWWKVEHKPIDVFRNG